MKKITGVIALAVLSSAAFANTIVPDHSRDGKSKSHSAIAISQEMRTFVAGEYNTNTEEEEGSTVDIDTTNMNVYGGWSNKQFTVEADINMGNEEEGTSEVDTDTYSVVGGYRLNNKVTLGLGYTMSSEQEDGQDDFDRSLIEIAGAYDLGKMILGASIGLNSVEEGTIDDSYTTLTVGVGSNGSARMPMQDQFGRTVYQNVEVKIDEKTLEEIADITDGKYFRATDKKSLEQIYKEIDKLEKSKIEVTEYKKKSEKFVPFALFAACLLLIEFLLKNIIFKGIV